MRIGLNIAEVNSPRYTLTQIGELAAEAEAEGFASLWFANLSHSVDALTVITMAGQATSTIELGTAVIPTYPRHPLALAQQAATTNVFIGGRLLLGVGPSHAPVIEDMHGMSYEKPARHVREYLEVLLPALREGKVDFDGETYRVHAAVSVAGNQPFPVLISALAPLMLRIAGELADGTITWMAGRRAIETHVVPKITAAASAAGRPSPRIVAGLPVAVCDDPAMARESAAKIFAGYGVLPNYRRVLDEGDYGTPADVAVVGDEATVEAEIRAFAAAGTTDFTAATFPVGDDSDTRAANRRRTRELLRDLANSRV